MYFDNIEQLKKSKLFKEEFKIIKEELDSHLKELIYLIPKKKIYDCSGFILLLIKNQFKGDWVYQFNNKPKNIYDKNYLINLFGEEVGYKIWDIKRNKSGCRLVNYINKYGEEEGKKKYKEKGIDSKKGQSSLQFYINKYGEEEGKRKWELIKDKWRNSIKINKKNRKGNGRSLNEYITRLGKTEGTLKWLERNNKQKFRFSKQFYINKYGYIEGENEWNKYLKNQDRTSLKAFVKKYGNDDGIKRYSEYCIKQKNGFKTTLENFILKYGELEGGEKHKNWIINCTNSKKNGNRYSKISQKLFWEIYESVSDKQKELIKFAELNEEQMFKIWEHGLTVIFVDFKIKNCIIEFQGTYYHNFENVKEKDKKRLLALEEKGYCVLFVTQEEYEKNKIETINKCISFINKNYE